MIVEARHGSSEISWDTQGSSLKVGIVEGNAVFLPLDSARILFEYFLKAEALK